MMSPVRGSPTQGRFIGRATELGRLDAALARAATGAPAIEIVAGEAGVGKSAVVAAFLEHARAAGASTIIGHCLDRGSGGYPFAPFVEIFRTLISDAEPARLPALLGPARGEFGRLLPELAGRIGVGPPPAPIPGAGPPATVHLFELILGTVERLTTQQLMVIVIENLQWADDASRDLLAFLVRTVRRGRVLLLVTLRTDEIARGDPLVPFLAELERDSRVERIDLMRFDRQTLRDLLSVELGHPPDAALADRIMERSGGNAFYALQLLAAAQESGSAVLPGRLRDVLLARVAALSEPTQELLRTAAVGGRLVDDRLLAAATGASDRDVRSALREALDRGLLASSPDGARPAIAFNHVLLQEAIAADLLPGERASAHAAYAAAIEAEPSLAGSPAAAAAELARHWDGAGRAERALPASAAAANAAYDVHAYGDALRLYERAIQLAGGARPDQRQTRPTDPARDGDSPGLDLADLLHRAAEAASLSGRYSRAVELGRSALDRTPLTDAPSRRGFLEERLRWYLWESGDVEAALASAKRWVDALPENRASASRSRALTHLAGILMFSGRFDESRPIAEKALQTAREAGALPEAAIALGVLAWDEAASGSPDRGAGRLREAIRVAALVGSDEGLALGHTNLAALLDQAGQTEEALAEALRGIALVERVGLADTYGGVLRATAANASFDLGQWPEAERLISPALEARVAEGDVLWVRLVAARIALGYGRLDAARRHLEVARALAERPTAARHRAAVATAAAELELADGQLDAARVVAEEWANGSPAGSWPVSVVALAAVGVRVEAESAARAWTNATAGTEARERGRRFVERAHAAASPAPTDRQLEAFLALTDAEATTLARLPDPALWAAVAVRFAALPRPYLAAYARLREAEAAIASRSMRAASTTALREAQAAATHLGATLLIREVGALARRARIDLAETAGAEMGQRSAAETAIQRLGLTPREEEVLRLVTAGRSNREIGQALFISQKTASVHVSNILAKLGAEGRTEAAAIAHRLGIEPAFEASDAPPEEIRTRS
jgi:DNA-binding CsgD family transcriptional regulator